MYIDFWGKRGERDYYPLAHISWSENELIIRNNCKNVERNM